MQGFKLWFLRRFSEYRDLKKDKAWYQRKVNSDHNLIESLNRYIKVLEGKAKVQEELIQELRGRLDTLLTVNNTTNREDIRDETRKALPAGQGTAGARKNRTRKKGHEHK
ncbi:MAG: hypothetical protein FWD36_03295 [Treponema sp.]|nr:hypothetical protein [Treponema sp.]